MKGKILAEGTTGDYVGPFFLNCFQLTYVQMVLKNSSLVGDAFKVNMLGERNGLQ